MPQPHAHLTSGKQHGVAVSPRGQPLHLLKQVCAAALPHPALAGGCGSPHGANFWQLATHQASSHGPAWIEGLAAEAETTRTAVTAHLYMVMLVMILGLRGTRAGEGVRKGAGQG